MKHPLFKPDDFLCERCGYVLNGLPLGGNCPECGRPIIQSHPDNRVGSPWQRKASASNFIRTHLQVCVHPLSVWNSLRVQKRGSTSLLFISGLFAGMCYVLPLLVFTPLDPEYPYDDSIVTLLTIVTFGLVVIGCTMIEQIGIRAFAKRRKWRITSTHARVICNHAMVGWIIGSFFFVLFATTELLNLYSFFFFTLRHDLEYLILGGILGMLWFETLVYIGFRKMRYANPPGVAQPIPPSPESGRNNSEAGEQSVP